MKQSTFSAQVANNLLTLLQGYSKTIRLLLVMFLTLTASTAWGAKITTYSSIVTGKTYYIGATTGGTDYYLSVNGASTSTSIAGTAVTTKANATAFVFTGSGTSWKIKFADYANYLGLKSSKDNGKVQVVSSAATFTASNQSGKLRLSIGSYSIQKNNSGTQFGSYGNTQTDIWLEEVSGSDEPTTTYTIKWHTAVGVTTDMTLEEGATITKPATDPTMTGYTFMGWTEDCEVASDGAGFTPITNFGTATEDKDFYAVFAVATTTGGGGSEIKTYSFNITTNDFNTTSYAANNDQKTTTATATDGSGSTMSVKWTSYQVMKQSNAMQWQKSKGLIYNDTNLGNITSVVVTSSAGSFTTYYGTTAQPSSGTTAGSGNGYFQVKVGNATGSSTNIKVTFEQEVAGGGSTTTYNNYITTCAGSTPEPDPIPVTGVSLDITSHEMQEGETVNLIATVTPDDADDKTVTWKSSDENIAKVNTNGIVTAVSEGTATITVTTKDGGHTATCTIKVNPLPTVEGTWTLVTNAANLKAGDRIVIAAAEYDFALSTTQNSNNRGQASVTKNGNNITFTEATQIITLEATGESTVPFAFNVGTAGYLYAAAANSNYLKTKTTLDDHGKWAITINADTASIIASTSTNRNVMQYNKTNGLFACYASASQEPIAIYKETSSTPDPVQLATPTGLSATKITSSGATLSWNTVEHASSYTVSVYGENDEVIAEYTEITKTTTEVSGLDSETDYIFGVVAVGDGITYTNSIQAVSDVFTTPAATSPATITLSELGVTKTISTYSVGDQYTLPTTSSQSCDGKELVGWSTVEVVETNTKPTSNYYELGAEVTLAATQTFYAVFATKGGIPSTDYNQITSIEDLTDGNYVIAYGYNTTSPTIILKAETKDESTLVATSAGPTDNKYTDPAASNIWEIKKTNTTYTLYNAATSKYIQATNTPSLKLADANPTEFQISYSTDHWKIKLNTANTYQLVGYTNASGNYFQTKASPSGSYKIQLYKSASTVVYSAYSTSCIPTYSITYDFAGGTGSHCSNTSVPQGDTYTICDDAPTKEGNTFLHWSDGTSTYAAGATITPTGDVTLTAVWKANTYTVTWNSNGATTSKTYNHGDALVVPDAPASCDGVKEFVGWTTHSGYYHATTAPDDLFTTKTTPVTATATYYAVFATPGAGGTEFVLGESGTFKMYANVDGTNHYAQGGVSSKKLSSTTDILTASDYTLIYADGSYTIKQGTSAIGHSSKTDLSTTASTWTISEGANGSWRITSDEDNSRALSYSAEANAFKAYATSNLTAGNETYFDIEFGSGSDAHSDYTTICQTVESIEIANYTTEFFVTDEFAFGGTVTAHFDGGGTQDVTALAHFSGYNMNVTGTYTITVTYMGATATYEITVKPLDNAWVLTWNVSGKTNTGLGPRSVTKGSAIGTLPTPIVPDACAGKTFMGWTTSNIVNSDGSGITYITRETVPTANTTYYAVFATVNNFCTQKPIDQIYPGSKVVIVAVASLTDDGGAGKAISSRATDDTYNLQGDDVAIYDQTINTPHNTCIWTINKEGEKYIFTQDGKYLNAIKVDTHYNLKYNDTKDTWSLTSVAGKENTYRMQSTNTAYFAEFYTGKFTLYKEANDQGEFDMQFFVTANANGEADITDYTTGCAEYTITYYGFQGGYSTSCSSDGTIVLPVNSLHTIPNCGDVVKDHTNLNRTFTGVWMTQPHGGHTFKPGDTFILTQDTTLYAQWELNTQNDFTTLPTDVEDLAGTDIYVYGGKTLTLQPGTTTINSLTLKGGIQTDGSYQMPSIWVPEGATLVRNSNKIYLDLVVNAENWYPFAVPFETKNTSDIHYLHPDMKSAAKYSKHFDIKTYDGARRADVGEDKANNWVRLKRHTAEEPVSFKPGVGYIISAMAYPGTDTATIRIPMTVPNTWFKNGEQAVVGTTVRNTIDVTAHTGEAATEHQRHAGWNFVANPYLSNFTGGGIDASNGLDYIDGELIIQGSYEYSEETVPYVTIPAYNFAYYSQHKLSEVKLSPEWSFFVQVGTSGTMDFTTTGRQQAPASIAARAEERPVKMDVDITLSDNHSSDQTGIIISDRYNDTYEIGRDLEKLFGSAYNLSVYTLMADNTPLAFQALAIRSNMQVIPVGYRAPEQGEYTFRLNEATSSIDLLNEQYEQLVLVDYQTGELTNLLISDYTFYSERTQADNRFAIYAVSRQNAPTDLPNAIGQDKEAQKIIHNGHLYILRDGNVYNGNGQIVK